MAENGNEKVVAVAHHIAKTLGHSDTMTDDILRIFSDFDGRLREKLTEKLSRDGPERTLNSLHRQLSPHFSTDAPFWSSSFLASVDQLIAVIHEWSPPADDGNERISSCLHRAEGLLQKSMSRLKDEFRSLIRSCAKPLQLTDVGSPHRPPDYSDEDRDFSAEDDENCIPVAQAMVDYSVVVDVLPAGTIGDLHEIAKRMVAARYGQECSQVYSECRRELLEESMFLLGFQKLSIHEVHKMQWSQLEDEIGKWIKAIKVALRILFPSEQRLCDRVFAGLSPTADLCFMEVCSSWMIWLLNFAGAVAVGNRAPERLFKMLDIYETVRDLMPEFELIFSSDCCLSLRDEAVSIWQRLREAIQGIFMELENLIRQDPAKPVVPGGGLHPISPYVMSYLCAACRSRQTLEQVFEGNNDGALPSSSSLAVQIAWLMELLESNLEAKSKVYRDPALCSVFLMNSGRYIVQKVKGSEEMGSVLGDDWIREHTAKIRQCHVKYRRSSWGKVLGVLKVDNTYAAAPKSLREKLKLFNSYFEEICKIQSSWVICDEQLREELRISVSGMLSPAYRNFIGKFPDAEKHPPDRYVRYSVEDVEVRITELFQGTPGKR